MTAGGLIGAGAGPSIDHLCTILCAQRHGDLGVVDTVLDSLRNRNILVSPKKRFSFKSESLCKIV
jgi:hypothetical protein